MRYKKCHLPVHEWSRGSSCTTEVCARLISEHNVQRNINLQLTDPETQVNKQIMQQAHQSNINKVNGWIFSSAFKLYWHVTHDNTYWCTHRTWPNSAWCRHRYCIYYKANIIGCEQACMPSHILHSLHALWSRLLIVSSVDWTQDSAEFITASL